MGGSMGSASAPFGSALADRLQDDHPDVRTSAAKALRSMGELASSHAIEIARALSEDSSGAVRAAAASALGALGTVGCNHGAELSAALVDDDDDVRVAAVVSMGELGVVTSDSAAMAA